MLRLSTEKLKALSERLRERGAPPSIARPASSDPVTEMLLYEYGPLCEVMFLAMSSDGALEQAEKDIIRGALRELDDRIRTEHFASMLERAEQNLAAEGMSARLSVIAREMDDDPVRGDVAFVLASAIVYADSDVTSEESWFLNDLADSLGIDDERSEQLQRLLL